jgi:DUF4097 and DUF4098 domain-containing protein YvlB
MKKMTAVLAIILLATAAFSQTVEEKSCTVAPDCRIRVKNIAGSVNVTAWDRNEIHLKATLGRDVERLDFTCTESVVRVEVVVPNTGNKKIESDLEMSVPAGSSLDIETVSADTHTYNVGGRIVAAAVSGNVQLENVVGPVTVRSVSGDVTISGSSPTMETKSVSGDIKISGTIGELGIETVSGSSLVSGTVAQMRAKAISGDITFQGTATSASAETVSGDIKLDKTEQEIEAYSVSGSINLVGERVSSAQFNTTSGEISYTGEIAEKGSIKGSSRSGSITVYTSDNPGVLYDLTSKSGEIETFYNVPAQREQEHGPGAALRLGQEGAASIVLETLSGNIQIKRR